MQDDIQVKVYGEFKPEEQAALQKIRVIAQEAMHRARLVDGILKLSAYADFMTDRFAIALAGFYWGRRVGDVVIATPATWWDAVKSELVRHLTRHDYADDEDERYDDEVPEPAPLSDVAEAKLGVIVEHIRAVRAAMEQAFVGLEELGALPEAERLGVIEALYAAMGKPVTHERRIKVNVLFPGYVPPEGEQGAAYAMAAMQ